MAQQQQQRQQKQRNAGSNIIRMSYRANTEATEAYRLDGLLAAGAQEGPPTT